MKKIFNIDDMHCSACVMRLEEIEDDLPGVISAQASYHKQEMMVEWDDRQVGETQIIAAIQAKGYSVVKP